MTQLELSSVTPWETTATPSRLYRKQFEPAAEVLPHGNCGLGQLTTIGYQQHIANGQVRATRTTRPSDRGLGPVCACAACRSSPLTRACHGCWRLPSFHVFTHI